MHSNIQYSQISRDKLLYISSIIFADDIASGRPCKIIDDFISQHIYPFYSNTHSNATCGIKMRNYIKYTRSIIKKHYGVSNIDNYKILFCGNGATSSVNHMISMLKKQNFFASPTIIYLSINEHYSNHLPWKETNNCIIKIIPHNEDTTINFDQFEKMLTNDQNEYIPHKLGFIKNQNHSIIVSVTACSNVTGIFSDINHLISLKMKFHFILAIDYACSAPYKKITVNNVDFCFVSGHKFLGGPSSPGLLIFNNDLFHGYTKPCYPGGGCVAKYSDDIVSYSKDIETLESAGSPNVVGIIRFGLCIHLQSLLYDFIQLREHEIVNIIDSYINDHKPSNLHFISPINPSLQRLPIYSCIIDDVHYNFIVVLMNDIFNIQTRGGISCCGMLSEHLKLKGWCRISFNYLFTNEMIKYIMDSLFYIANNYTNYINMYIYDENTNLFTRKSLVH